MSASDHDLACHLFADGDAGFLDIDDDVIAERRDDRNRSSDDKTEIFQVLFHLGGAADMFDDVFFSGGGKTKRHHDRITMASAGRRKRPFLGGAGSPELCPSGSGERLRH